MSCSEQKEKLSKFLEADLDAILRRCFRNNHQIPPKEDNDTVVKECKDQRSILKSKASTLAIWLKLEK